MNDHLSKGRNHVRIVLPLLLSIAMSCIAGTRDWVCQETSRHKFVEVEAELVFNVPSPNFLHGIAISPDGTMLAESQFRKVRVWSIEEEEVTHSFVTRGHTHAPIFTPDGKRVVASEAVGNLEYGSTLIAWDLKSKQSQTLGKCVGMVSDITFSDNGQFYMAVSSYGPIMLIVSRKPGQEAEQCGELNLWRQGQPENPLKIPCRMDPTEQIKPPIDEARQQLLAEAMSKAQPSKVALNSDATRFVTTKADGTLEVFSVPPIGASDMTLPGDGSRGEFTPDGGIRCASKSWGRDGKLLNSRPSTNQKYAVFAGQVAAFSPDNSTVVVEHLARKQVARLRFPESRYPLRFAIGADGKSIAVATDNRIRLWHLPW